MNITFKKIMSYVILASFVFAYTPQMSAFALSPKLASDSNLSVSPSPRKIISGLYDQDKDSFAIYLYSIHAIYDAINIHFDKGRPDEAADIAVSAITKGIQGIDSSIALEWIRKCFDKGRPDKAAAIAISAIDNGIQGIDSSHALEWIRKCFDKGRPDIAADIAISAITNGISGIDSPIVLEGINKCFDKGWFSIAAKLAISAIAKGMQGIDSSIVSEGINKCFGVGWPGIAADIAISAIAKGMQGIDSSIVLEGINKCFGVGWPGIAAEIAIRAITKGIQGIDSFVVLEWINKCFDQREHGETANIAVNAIIIGMQGIDSSIVSEWINKCFDKGRPDEAADIAVSAINKGMQGIDSSLVLKWINKCSDKGEPGKAAAIAISAIDNGMQGIDSSLVLEVINKCFDKGRPDEAADIAVSAITKGIQGIDSSHVLEWIKKCFDKKRAYRAVEIAISAITKGIQGISSYIVSEGINKCLDEREPYRSAEIAIFFAAKNNQYSHLAGKIINIFSQKDIEFILSNQFAISQSLELDEKKFNNMAALSTGLRDAFNEANGKIQDRARRFDEELFIKEYMPIAYALELVYEGSMRHITGLLEKSDKPFSAIRLLDLKRAAMSDADIAKALMSFVNNIKNTRSRKKVKLDIDKIFKIVDIADGLARLSQKQIVIKRLNQFEFEGDINDSLDSFYRELILELLKVIARSIGIEAENISATAYGKIYLPLISRLNAAISHIKAKNPGRLAVFTGLLKSMFEDNFRSYIENINQSDESGKKLAVLNKGIRDKLEALSINVSRWLGWEQKDRLEEHEFMYYEKTHETYDAVADIDAAQDYLVRFLNINGLVKAHKDKISDYLNSIGISITYESGKAVKLVTGKQTKKNDIYVLLADKNILTNLIKLTDEILGLDQVKDNPAMLETTIHMKERLATLKERLSFETYAKDLGNMRKYFTIRPIQRSPGHDLFLGDFTDCCLAMNSNQFPHAMVERLIDEGCNVIEVIDQATQKTMALAWLYIDEEGNLIIQNLEVNAEYEKTKPLMNFIGQNIITYTQAFAEHINAKILIIGMPGHGKYFGQGSFIETHYKEVIIPYNKDKIGGYFQEKYYLDSAGKPEAYFVAKTSFPAPAGMSDSVGPLVDLP